MIRTATLMLLLCGSLAGCVEMPLVSNTKSEADVKTVKSNKPRPAAPVTPEQINDKNAREKAEALRKELDLEIQEPSAPGTEKSRERS